MTRTLSAWIILSVACILGCGEDHPAPHRVQQRAEVYRPPPAGTKSLVSAVEVYRDAQANVIVKGKILLPQDTKIVVDVFRANSRKLKDLVGESKTIVGFQNSFSAGPFGIPKAGRYDVEITSYFNGPWQQPAEVIAAVGAEGTKLPRAALVPEDAEFADRGGHVDSVTSVTVPPLPPEFQAIEAVKRSKLFVRGKGQAVDSVADIVKFFAKPGLEFYPGTWSAEKLENAKWKVSLQHRWGKDAKTANWEYDSRTGQVRYLDPEAKMLSWIPSK